MSQEPQTQSGRHITGRGKSVAPHLPDKTPSHILQCAACRTHFRATVAVPGNLSLLFGTVDQTLTCLEPEEISTYLEGRCTPLERESIEMHLADCSHCRGRLQSRKIPR